MWTVSDTGLRTRPLERGQRLQPILEATLDRRGGRATGRRTPASPFWNSRHFGLDGVTAFRRARPAARRRVLAACGEDLLTEAYGVEKLGLGFTAKMLLLSETTEERMLYALFAADEATHLDAIQAYAPADAPARAEADPFLRLVAEAIADGRKPGLTYLIQVVLEGWGLSHYQALGRACADEGLRRTFRRLVQDEALHHGSGVVLAARAPLAGPDRAQVLDVLLRLCRMVQVGPQRIVARLDEIVGPLTRRRRVAAFRELRAEAGAAARLDLLRRLMRPDDSVDRALARYGAFRALGPEACAAASLRCSTAPRQPDRRTEDTP